MLEHARLRQHRLAHEVDDRERDADDRDASAAAATTIDPHPGPAERAEVRDDAPGRRGGRSGVPPSSTCASAQRDHRGDEDAARRSSRAGRTRSATMPLTIESRLAPRSTNVPTPVRSKNAFWISAAERSPSGMKSEADPEEQPQVAASRSAVRCGRSARPCGPGRSARRGAATSASAGSARRSSRASSDEEARARTTASAGSAR